MLRTVADLLNSRIMQKTVGDLVADPSPENTEAQILVGLEDCQNAIADLEQKLANMKAKFIGGMTPQSRSVLSAMGHADLEKSLNVVREASLQWQKRLGVVRRSQASGVMQKNFGGAVAELRTMEGHMALILAGSVKVDERTRRMLANRIGVAQMMVAQGV